MKPTQSVVLATWMLRHLSFGPCNDALVGDLLEEFRAGRSARWYWRQALCAIGVGVLSRSRNYALPLLFSTAWSMLYPLWWLSIVKLPLVQTVLTRWASIDLPYSTALQGVSKIIPAITFVWLGFFIFLALSRDAIHGLSRLRLLGSLSISLNVLFVATIALWIHLKLGESLSYVARESFSHNSHLVAISVPLTFSLLSAISFALARTHERRRASIAG